MNKIQRKWTILLAILCCVLISFQAYADNKLSIPDVVIGKGGTIYLPVNLENDDPVVALQFTLTLPSRFTINTSSPKLTERKDDHAVRVSKNGNNYLCIVYSPSNAPFRGNRGTVLTITLTAYSSVVVGNEYSMAISDAVASDAAMNNVLTEATVGTITVAEGVDLEPKKLKADASSCRPGDHLVLTWDVQNTGQVSTTGGWREELSLVDNNGSVCSLGTAYYDGLLGAGATVSRQAEVVIPRVPGMNGSVKPQVRIIPNSDSSERPEAQGNNTMTGSNVQLASLLYLDLSKSQVEETTTKPLNAVVTRSGNRNQSMNVTLASSDGRLSLPSTVTIGEGQSSVNVPITLVDNEVVDDNDQATVTARASGYPDVTATLAIEDNEHPQLTLEASQREMNEGETLELTVTIPKTCPTPTTVSLSCDASGRFTALPEVVIPAGSMSATVEVTSVDDNAPALEQTVTFMASSNGFNSDEVWVTLFDNDMPTMDLVLTPTTVSEAGGPNAIMAKLRRLDHSDAKITVKLSDDSQGDLTYPQTITMAEGITEVQFSIGTRDNQIVDGERNINVTAAIYIKSCSCQAQGGSAGSVTRQVTITDNDGPAVNISSSRSTITEGSEATLTVSRNANFDQSLTVNLSSDNDTDLEYDHMVTIPAGASSVQVVLQALENDIADDDHLVTLTAQADGFAVGSCWVMISNQTLPDAVISAFSLSPDEVIAGQDTEATVVLANTGSYELPSQTKVTLYLNDGTQLLNMYSQVALAPGESTTITRTVTMPEKVGSFQCYAVVNEGHKVKELVTGNNTSEKVPVTLLSPFGTITLTTDKTVYGAEETIHFSGTLSGNVTQGTEVEVYYICDGLRRTLPATVDAAGHFSAVCQPFAGDMGHFIAGACYPGEKASVAMTEFDIVGLKRTSSEHITCDVIIYKYNTTGIEIVNPTTLSQHNVRVNVLSQPDNYELTFNPISVLDCGATATIDMTVKGTGLTPKQEWERAQLEIVSDEGARTTMTVYLYCRASRAKLVADISEIKAKMTKGQSRIFMFNIMNTGQGSTGKITLRLPDWMSAVTPTVMPALEQGDSARVVLSFTPTDDMQLNVPRMGEIAINCETGTGLKLPFTVEPVSDSNGTLVVDVCDEYTYYTAEAPHVQGAHVVVKHPTNGEVLAEGYTGDNGRFTVTLPEGYYTLRVSADKHESYANYIMVEPDSMNLKIINLSFQAITTNWTVKETEVEDHYEIVTTYTYETNVPRPVVTIKGPTRVDGDEMAVGESRLLYFTVTNVGLIETRDVEFVLPKTNGEWSMTALAYTEPFTLAANDSVIVPVVLTRLGDEPTLPYVSYSGNAEFRNCIVILYGRYRWVCGQELKDEDAYYMFAVEYCDEPSIVNDTNNKPDEPDDPSGSGGYYKEKDGGSVHPYEMDVCNPLHSKCLEGLISDFLSAFCAPLGFAIKVYNIVNDIKDIVTGEGLDSKEAGGLFLGFVVKAPGVVGAAASLVKKFFSYVDKVSLALTCIQEIKDANNWLAMPPTGEDWLDDFCVKSEYTIDQTNHMFAILTEMAGDSIWFNPEDKSIPAFWEKVANTEKSDFNFETLLPYKPECVSEQQLAMLIDRFNNSYPGSTAVNGINADSLLYHYNEYMRYDQIAQDQGYETMADMFNASYDVMRQILEREKNSVCTSVKMQLSQHMVMTRQAFRGTLTVYNGHESKPLRDAKLTLVVTDEDGNLATAHEFEIVPESLDGFQGELSMDAGWLLNADETGTATILFIPTKYAAPMSDKVYSFGGSLSYIDPFTDMLVTRELYPEHLTVTPSPRLALDYFMQRDIYGDDPFTMEIELMKNAEFAVVIDNQGYGDARNVKMTTRQPEIIENEKGLLIDFELVSSQLNGQDALLAMGEDIITDFGTIRAHDQAYAQWWLRSTLLGHFTTYDVSYNHLTSYGNDDLSLIDTVRVHELIHGFTTDDAMGNPMRGFMVNDLPDAWDLPDKIYFSNATQEGVATSEATIRRIGDREFLLEVTSSAPGWNYGSVLDPTLGRQQLVSVVRQSDGMELPVDNVWATDRTLIDGVDWLYESRLHYVVEMTGLNESYILTLYSKPGDVDGNGKVNITDVTKLINYLLDGIDADFLLGNADLNGDGQVTILDVGSLINILLTTD